MMNASVQADVYTALAATETKVDAVTPGSGRRKLIIVGFCCFNPSASAAAYIQFFDALATNVSLGSTTPKFVLPLPIGGGFGGPYPGIIFGTNICYAVTATASGAGAPGSACVVQFSYV